MIVRDLEAFINKKKGSKVLVKYLVDFLSRDLFQKRLSRFQLIDDLTGVFNKRKLVFDLGHKLENNLYFHLFLIDINGFKLINDRYGHVTGTKILKSFCEKLSCLPCSKGRLYRYGGDEFVLLIDQGSMDNEEPQLLSQLRQEVIVELDGKNISLSTSIGTYRYQGQKVKLDEILDAADQRMYESKKGQHFFSGRRV